VKVTDKSQPVRENLTKPLRIGTSAGRPLSLAKPLATARSTADRGDAARDHRGIDAAAARGYPGSDRDTADLALAPKKQRQSEDCR
jgi:hypothetical protein